jgi:hypothetical protein
MACLSYAPAHQRPWPIITSSTAGRSPLTPSSVLCLRLHPDRWLSAQLRQSSAKPKSGRLQGAMFSWTIKLYSIEQNVDFLYSFLRKSPCFTPFVLALLLPLSPSFSPSSLSLPLFLSIFFFFFYPYTSVSPACFRPFWFPSFVLPSLPRTLWLYPLIIFSPYYLFSSSCHLSAYFVILLIFFPHYSLLRVP